LYSNQSPGINMGFERSPPTPYLGNASPQAPDSQGLR
jgi:hypothetical protein